MSSNKVIEDAINDHINVANDLLKDPQQIANAVSMVIDTFRNSHKLILAGNGGSAADAQHWAAEWVIRLTHNLDRPAMPAIALTTDSSILTAGANDIGYDNVFARQLEALGQEGDLFIAISTSGNSENLLRASKVAKEKNIRILGILGKDGGKQLALCDEAVIAPSGNTQRIQEMHIIIGHLLCELSEKALYE